MFKLVVSDPKTKKTYQKEVPQKESGLLNMKIKDKVKGEFLGLPGYELEITGGSDKQGFPMRRNIQGVERKRILLTGGPGFHPKAKGERRRKSIRGNTISSEIVQVNTKIVKYGTKKLGEIFGKEEKKEEKPKEEAKPEAKQEEKKEIPKEETAKKEPEKEEAKPETKAEEAKKKEAKPEGKAETKKAPGEEKK